MPYFYILLVIMSIQTTYISNSKVKDYYKAFFIQNYFLGLIFVKGGFNFLVLLNFVQIFTNVLIRLSAQYLVALNISTLLFEYRCSNAFFLYQYMIIEQECTYLLMARPRDTQPPGV